MMSDRFIVKVRGDQYVIIDTTTGQRVGLAAGTRTRAEREAAIYNGASVDSYACQACGGQHFDTAF